MLIPIAWANRAWVRPTKRRSAVTSAPVSKRPAIRRRRWRAEIARANCAVLSSGGSIISGLQVGEVEGALAPGSPAGADNTDQVVVLLGKDDESEPAPDRSDGEEAVLGVGVLVVEDLEVVDV